MFHMQQRQLLLSSLFKKKTSIIMPLGVFLVILEIKFLMNSG